MAVIQFSTGIEEYVLNDKVSVRFNPTDTTFIEKLFDAFNDLDERQEKYSERITNTNDTKEILSIVKDANNELRNVIDTIFDKPICADLFGETNVYAMADGLPIWANLLLAIIDEIDTSFVNEKKQTDTRMGKYLAKYKKRG